MGTGILQKLSSTAAEISRDHLNRIIDAVQNDFLPRNSAGALSSGDKNLGSPNFPWNELHVKGKIFQDGQELVSGSGGGAAAVTGGALSPGIAARLAGGYVKEGRANASGEPTFLIPAGSNGVRVYASSTEPLVIVHRNGAEESITSSENITLPPHRRSAGSSNTARIGLSDTDLLEVADVWWDLRGMGVQGTRTPLTNVGGDWTREEDEFFGFSTDESGSDMSIGRVIGSVGLFHLTDVWRAWMGKKGAGADDYVPGVVSAVGTSGATLSHASLMYLFRRRQEGVGSNWVVHNRSIFLCSSPLFFDNDNPNLADGDIRLNVESQRYEIYTAAVGGQPASWSLFDAVIVGVLVPTSASGANASCDFARGVYPDNTLREMARFPILSGGEWIGGDDDKFRPNFSPNYVVGSAVTSVDYRPDPILDERDQVKYAQTAGATKLSPDWIFTQSYQFVPPTRSSVRIDNSRARRLEIDLDLPTSPADNDRILFYIGNDLSETVTKDTLTPPAMLECAGRQFFIHPRQTKHAFASAKRNGQAWQVQGIHRVGEVSLNSGDMFGIRQNGSGELLNFSTPLRAAFIESEGDGARYTQRGRSVRITSIGRWVEGPSGNTATSGQWAYNNAPASSSQYGTIEVNAIDADGRFPFENITTTTRFVPEGIPDPYQVVVLYGGEVLEVMPEGGAIRVEPFGTQTNQQFSQFRININRSMTRTYKRYRYAGRWGAYDVTETTYSNGLPRPPVGASEFQLLILEPQE